MGPRTQTPARVGPSGPTTSGVGANRHLSFATREDTRIFIPQVVIVGPLRLDDPLNKRETKYPVRTLYTVEDTLYVGVEYTWFHLLV